MKIFFRSILILIVVALSSFALTNSAFAKSVAKTYDPKGETITYQPLFGWLENPFWYIGGNYGLSHTHDKTGGGGASVDQDGPGWNVNVGYNFLRIYQGVLGAELGYTQYADSVQTFAGNVAQARTEHYSAYLAAAAMHPLFWRIGILGKFGLGWAYARKTFSIPNVLGTGSSWSPYGALGLTFTVSQRAALALQAARNWGNNSTGSTDLYSLGVIIAIS